MSGLFAGYGALLDLCMINALLALSQYIVLRAGLFSLATAGFAAFGAFAAGNLILWASMPLPLAVLAGAAAGGVAALILSLPLARLRGVYQAIATLAFVQIVMSLALYAEPVTGGATGLNAIPKLVETWHIAFVLALVTYLVASLGASPAGLAFDVIRQDETVAVSLGIDVARSHALAFALSGTIAGAAGALMAGHNYSVVAEEFGFGMLVATLSFVVLGGRRASLGPLLGALVLTLLPEIARPLADNRMVIYGALLMAAIVYLPHGIVDTIVLWRRRARQPEDPAPLREAAAP